MSLQQNITDIIVNNGGAIAGSANNIKSSIEAEIRAIYNSTFVWEDLPEGLKSAYIEEWLFDYGMCGIFKFGGKFYTLPASKLRFDFYNNITQAYLYSPYNGENAGTITNKGVGKKPGTKWTGQDTVFVRNNKSQTKTLFYVYGHIQRLQDIWSELWTDIKFSKNKKLIGTNAPEKSEALAVAVKQIEDAVSPTIFLNDNIMTSISKAVDIGGKSNQKDLWENYRNVKEELFKTLGIIQDSRRDKAERVNVQEVNVSQIDNSLILSSMLEYRQQAVEEFNEFFDENISVSLNPRLNKILDTMTQDGQSNEGVNNE